MNDKGFYLVCFAFGVVTTLMLGIMHHQLVPPAHAVTGGSGSQTFLVTTRDGQSAGQGAAWIVDAEAKFIACYVHDNLRAIKFVGCRKIEFDMKMRELNDKSEKKYSVKELQEAWKKQSGDK